MSGKRRKSRSPKRNSRKRVSKIIISENEVFNIFIKNQKSIYTPKSLMRKLKFTSPRERARIIEILHRLKRLQKIIKVDSGGYIFNSSLDIIEGKVNVLSRNKAIIQYNDEEIYVDIRDLQFTFTGDIVNAIIYKTSTKHQAEVVSVKQRNKIYFVGKISKRKGIAFLIPENRKTYFDIFIPSHFLGEAQHNDKVKVEITAYPEKESDNPEGRVIEIFGKIGENEAEIHSIMAEFDLPMEFPRKVKRESEQIDEKISKTEISKRRDFRGTTTFTIDPHDAKDFDDALSIQKLDNNLWEIGVHIADVTHYVLPKSALDQEAFKRATSVYLVDRVVPMLPERLSNGICSLRPKEEKLTFSCVFKIDEKAKVHDVWIGRTVIYSDQRFSYEEAQERIENKQGSFSNEINVLNDIALKLRKERFANGSISFETQEVKFNLTKDGTPISVYVKERKEAHKMIEDFMLLANKKVAEFVYKRKKGKNKDTMVYRVHEAPDQDKLDQFSTFAKRFGYNVNVHSNISSELNALAEKTEGKIEHEVLQQLAIRSMSKAKYTTDALEHFGLGFAHYTHFTSPIRRYPDMMVHRLVQHYLDNGESKQKTIIEEECKHASDQERKAAQAERLSVKFKQVEYMQQFEGQTFEGVVTGVSEFGMFVEIGDSKCEGMVRLADMRDDYYYADVEKYEIIGGKKKKKFVLGQKLNVTVKETNLERKTIDLLLI